MGSNFFRSIQKIYSDVQIEPWTQFYHDKIKKIANEKAVIIDIGGGLRIDRNKNNRHEQRNAWMGEMMKGVDYKILDKTEQFSPDIVGDIHQLPFADNSVDAFICIAVLEHVENPLLGVEEMFRCLKPGGYCYISVPFIYHYHPMPGYYGDFYRFTSEGLRYMTRNFSSFEICNIRGRIETLMNLIPGLGRFRKVFTFLDILLGTIKPKQTSGFNVFCIK